MFPACPDAPYSSPRPAARQDCVVPAARDRRSLGLGALALICAGLVSGCNEKSTLLPFGNPLASADVTGSLAQEPPRFSLALLDAASRTEAEAALAKALDPASEGQSVSWTGQAGVRGAFVARGRAFLFEDQICRGFQATIDRPPNQHSTSGTACRQGLGGQEAGGWRVTSGLNPDL